MRIQDSNGSLHITNPSRPVQRVVEITGMANVLYKPQHAGSGHTLADNAR